MNANTFPRDFLGVMATGPADGHDTAAPFLFGTDTSAAIAPALAGGSPETPVQDASLMSYSLPDPGGLGTKLAQYGALALLGVVLVALGVAAVLFDTKRAVSP